MLFDFTIIGFGVIGAKPSQLKLIKKRSKNRKKLK